MSKRYYIEQIFYGAGLIVIGIIVSIFSMVYCEGDATFMLLILPIGIGTLFSNTKSLYKKESKKRI